MNIPEIPFNKHNAIQSYGNDECMMFLPYAVEMTNHLGTVHASAQFALAEACSGQFMLKNFPEYADGYLAVLRKSEVKFKKQTEDNIYAVATRDEDCVASFKDMLGKRRRSTMPIRVTITDEKGDVIMQGTFEWYVQRIEG